MVLATSMHCSLYTKLTDLQPGCQPVHAVLRVCSYCGYYSKCLHPYSSWWRVLGSACWARERQKRHSVLQSLHNHPVP